ncbi:hypothetical protein AVEN_75158-1 [Araneus ventricosus]|uniref:Uncharacterized protein n=1 Tax=Araneus ventricosus TaxID=182803 RepID=A0A4Y2LFB4_ARAVE|nr:hypothetical protein AVEN_75158-1 [Araneus ventricosus]
MNTCTSQTQRDYFTVRSAQLYNAARDQFRSYECRRQESPHTGRRRLWEVKKNSGQDGKDCFHFVVGGANCGSSFLMLNCCLLCGTRLAGVDGWELVML